MPQNLLREVFEQVVTAAFSLPLLRIFASGLLSPNLYRPPASHLDRPISADTCEYGIVTSPLLLPWR